MSKTFNTGAVRKSRRAPREQTPEQVSKQVSEQVSVDISAATASGSASAEGRVWSSEQQAIFAWCKKGEGNLVVRARAGTGKTTTIIEAAKMLPSSRVLLCAFNSRIAKELAARVEGTTIQAKTLHALGLAQWKRRCPRVQVDGKRGIELAKQALKNAGKVPTRESYMLVAKLATLGKETQPLNTTAQDLLELGLRFETFTGFHESTWDYYARIALSAMELAFTTQDNKMDFSDMLYLPLQAEAGGAGYYDYIIIDEAQDMNGAQLELALRTLAPRGSVIVVGDDRQAIYGFRGADSGSIDRLKQKLKATELTLTTTYRCATKVVGFANRWVPDLKAAPSAPEGVVSYTTETQMMKDVKSGDFIISRLNAPLMPLCLNLVTRGISARVEGKDIGRSILNLVEKLGPADLNSLRERVLNWEEQQSGRTDDDEVLSQIHDTAQAILHLASDSSVTSLDSFTQTVNRMFADTEGRGDAGCVTLMTGHKSKGLEAETVYVLTPSFKTGFPVIGSNQEENNLRYVVATRAKRVLKLVTSGGADEKKDESQVTHSEEP